MCVTTKTSNIKPQLYERITLQTASPSQGIHKPKSDIETGLGMQWQGSSIPYYRLWPGIEGTKITGSVLDKENVNKKLG